MSKPTLLEKLSASFYLASLLFGLTIWVMLPFLIYEVHDARANGKLIDVKIVASYMHNRGSSCSLRLTFTVPNGEEITIGDAKPGDFATCTSKKAVAGNFTTGKQYKFIVVGENYYIAQGEYWWSMVIATFGLLPYIYLVYAIKREKIKRAKKLTS